MVQTRKLKLLMSRLFFLIIFKQRIDDFISYALYCKTFHSRISFRHLLEKIPFLITGRHTSTNSSVGSNPKIKASPFCLCKGVCLIRFPTKIAEDIPIKCFVSHRPTDPCFWKSKKKKKNKFRITCKEASTLVYKHTILSYYTNCLKLSSILRFCSLFHLVVLFLLHHLITNKRTT